MSYKFLEKIDMKNLHHIILSLMIYKNKLNLKLK